MNWNRDKPITHKMFYGISQSFYYREVIAISKEQFDAELMYCIALSITKSMRKEELITKEEYNRIDTILLEKYQPTLGTLLAGKPLKEESFLSGDLDLCLK